MLRATRWTRSPISGASASSWASTPPTSENGAITARGSATSRSTCPNGCHEAYRGRDRRGKRHRVWKTGARALSGDPRRRGPHLPRSHHQEPRRPYRQRLVSPRRDDRRALLHTGPLGRRELGEHRLAHPGRHVTLKERHPLVLMVRETPLHASHLRLMALVAAAGAVVYPPVPAFYTKL